MSPRARSLRVVVLVAFLAVHLSSACTRAGASPPAGKRVAGGAAALAEIDRLVAEEQKLETAHQRALELIAEARKAGDDELLTRALVKAVQLRTGLDGFETAVRFLREQEWPASPAEHAVLDLFYGQALVHYQMAYSWEIQQRERVIGTEAVDLKQWTSAQIAEQAVAAFVRAWSLRESLGALPVKAWSDFLEINTYPAEVRGTLRDAVTYLLAEVLADTSLWTPEQSNTVWRLSLEELLAERPPAADLGDQAAHPLSKQAVVLADLQSWHRGAGRGAAELEARLMRARFLHQSVSDAADKRKIREDLASWLSAYRDVSWWSYGMATLAALVREADADPGSLAQARKLALEGAERHPGSPGAAASRRLIEEIEARDFQVTAMASDSPRRRSLQVLHKNLPALYFRAYRFDLLASLDGSTEPPLHRRGEVFRRELSERKADASWTEALPATPDYRQHATYVEPPLDRSGAYLILVSAREDFAERNNRLLLVQLLLGDLVLAPRGLEGGSQVVLALDGPTGAPLPGAVLKLFRHDWQKGHQLETTATAGADGVVRFSRRPNQSYFVVGSHGESPAMVELGWSGEPGGDSASQASLVFTDRSIYRPQQKVYWKVLAYGGKRARGQLKPLPATALTVTLVDPNGEEVGRATVSTNAYGTAAGEFAIPGGRPLGGWSVQTSLNGAAQIRVEEYKRPTFEVILQEPKEPLRLNRPAMFSGEVRYYFGLPVTGGRVGWQVTREPVYPWWWGWWGWFRGPGRGGSNERVERVAAGEATLGADGTFQVQFTPQADERESRDVSYRYRLSVDVTDEGGETREAEKSYRVGFTAVEARIELGAGFLDAGKPAKATVVRTDLNGGARAGAGRFRLIELVQPAEPLLPSEEPVPQRPGEEPGAAGGGFQTPGDRLRPRWEQGASAERTMFGWEDGREIAAGTVTHGADGRGAVVLPPLGPGAYRLRYETEDEFGAMAKAQAEWVVAGARGEVPVEVAALLQVEQSTVRVGETARLLVHSGFAGQNLLLETYQSGELRERRRLVAGRDQGLIEIPIAEQHRGGLAVRLTLLRDHQTVVVERAIAVPWDNQALEVDFSTFRDRIRPGARETWRVIVRAVGGAERERAPVAAAELLAYMYDRSLDLFAPHQPPVPLQLFPARALLGPSSISLGARHAQHLSEEDFVVLPEAPDLRPDRLLFVDGMGYGFGRGVSGGMVGGVMEMRSQAAVTMPQEEPAPPPADRSEVEDVVVTAETKSAADASTAAPALRSNFAETAFWQPHLLTGADGTAAIEFTVPDSVTSWSVWVHALTKDLRSGSTERETRSVKELLVRPYLPRFLREGDRAELRVVVNNAGEQPLSGQVKIEILDTVDESPQLAAFGLAPERASQPFTVEPGGGATVTFPLTAPRRIGTVAFKITGQAGAWSDGELRALPILPGRLHLAQSRFAALRGNETRVLTFEDLAAADDPTRVSEQLVVTLDAQLFYGVLDALPYLVNYPYECTEQTLNRFLSTGIVRSLFDRYPAVGKMAGELAARDTRYQSWIPDDPNRKMALEETPWLQSARGNEPGAEDQDLIKVLDPKIAGAQRDSALARLQEAQLPSGAFPWFPGGPPSDYMTAYLLAGFAKAAEFEVEVPREMVERGWNFLGQRYREEWSKEIGKKDGCCVELLTLLNYIASAYPDPSWMGEALPESERQRILDWSFAHWKTFSPYLKGFLALTLNRMDRRADALLVFDSVMDSAKTTRDEGTFWVPEDRSWLWYNDTIEGHAFALRALLELRPDDQRTAGLVQWLFLNKKLGHWRSTRSTAEVLYALAVYLERAGQLGSREAASVEVGNRTTRFVFEPDRYTGRNNQVVVPGNVVDAERAARVTVVQETAGLMFASATWHFATDQLPAEARGDLFQVERRYFRRLRGGAEVRLEPLAEGALLAPGDEVEVQLSLRSRAQAEYVHLRDPRAAGLEPGVAVSGYRYDLGIGWYEETRDSGANFFFEWLPAGEYTLKYRLRANLAGEFRVGPAQVQSMYAPEFVAYSAGNVVRVRGE